MSKQELTISQKIEKLKSDIDWFYGEDFSIDDSLERYEQAIKLAKEIEGDLTNMKNQVNIIDKDFSK